MEHPPVSVSSAFVYCYGKEPCLEAAFAAELLEACEGCEERVLGNVLDVSGPSEETVCQLGYVGGIRADDSLECSFVASVELSHQAFIINAFGHDYLIRAGGGRKITENSDFPFDFTNDIPVRFDTFPGALQ